MARRTEGDVTLEVHVRALLAEMDLRYQQRFDAQIKALDAALLAAEKAVQTALTAAEKAVTKAENAAEKRFESVNEFRQTLADQASQLMSRAEAQALLAAVDIRISGLDARQGANELRIEKMASTSGGLRAGWGFLLGAASLVGVVVAVVIALSSR